MATNLSRTSLLRILNARGYSACPHPLSGIPNAEVKSTVLPNKTVIAAVDNSASLTRVSIVFRAGSRNEDPENLGVAHVLRTAAGLSTRNCSQFAIIRNIQQVGANLTATSDRETICYTLEGTPEAVECAIPFLTEVATQQEFRPWEVSELSGRLQLDIATRPLQLRAIDLLHNAAFRGRGLGNSLFIPKTQIGKISSETLQHYVSSNFLSGRMAVVGSGISQKELTSFANSLKVENGEGNNAPSPYVGGELRSNKGGQLAFIAVAGEGAALKNHKEALAFAVLQGALGGGPQVKYGVSDNGIFRKALGNNPSVSSVAINASYSDTGLFGLLLAVPTNSARSALESAVKVLKSGSVSDEDVSRGKNQLKASILFNAESGADIVRTIGQEAVLTQKVTSADALLAEVDAVSTSDVANALKKAGKKLSLASVGNLAGVPFLDELK